MKKKRILYILHGIQIGGVEVALMSAIPELANKFDLRIIALGKISDQITGNLTSDEKKCLHSFDYKLWLYPLLIFKLLRFIRKFDPEIMICSLWRAALIGIIVKLINKKIRFFFFVHSTAFTHLLNKYFSELAIKTADRILTDSKATSDFVISRYKPKVLVKVISFFINPCPTFKSNPPAIQEEVKMLFLGRLNAVKNLQRTIDVIAYLRSKNLNVTLDLYGPADGVEKDLQRYVQQKNLGQCIRFKGELYNEKAETMRKYNFLIQLSTREGMAMSVIEAMQNGLVCIVTPVGEIPNYAWDMKNAIFIDIWQPELWMPSLHKIEKVIKNKSLFQKLSSASRDSFKDVESYSNSLTRELNSLY